MNASELRQLLRDVHEGRIDSERAAEVIGGAMSQAPFEDLGFARLDTHRAWRQGFPEVVLGMGKTPAQIAAISERIVANGHSLLVTRTTAEAYEAVRVRVPDAEYHETATAIFRKQGEIPAGKGTVVIACAGTSDLPVAEVAALTADLLGQTVARREGIRP